MRSSSKALLKIINYLVTALFTRMVPSTALVIVPAGSLIKRSKKYFPGLILEVVDAPKDIVILPVVLSLAKATKKSAVFEEDSYLLI